MNKHQLLHDFEWHDLPVEEITIGSVEVAVVVTPYSEARDAYRCVVLTLGLRERLNLVLPSLLSDADLTRLEVSSLTIAETDDHDQISGELTLLVANARILTISFERAAWELREYAHSPADQTACHHRADPPQIWVFNGASSAFPSGVFSSRQAAEAWIQRHTLSGTLTEYPLDVGTYDWAVDAGYFTASNAKHRTSEFIGTFMSGAQQHFHYDAGTGGEDSSANEPS